MISANAELTGSYDYLQVALSGLIAMSASYAALDLAGRVTATSGWRSIGLVNRWCRCDGHRHLVDALHRHAGLPLACPGGLRLADCSAVAPGRYPFFGFRTLCGESAENGLSSRFDRQRHHGRRHRRLALHRHGAMRLAAVCRFDLRLVTLSVVLAIVFSLAAL